MPEISRFLGIVITMHYDDHVPPHFHARYAGFKATISIETLGVLAGSLPPRVLGLVAEWGAMRREELTADWELAREQRPPLKIDPLE